MRFACNSCLTRYTLADEKVRGRILKIRCKTCGTVMEVRDPALAAPEEPAFDQQATKALDPAEAMRLASGADQAAADSWENQATRSMPAEEALQLVRRTEPSPAAEWFAMRRGEQLGPMQVGELERKLAIGELGPRSYVWRDGMADWQRLEAVEELAALAGAATGTFVPTPGPLAAAPVEPAVAPPVEAEVTPAPASHLDAASLFDMPEASAASVPDEPAPAIGEVEAPARPAGANLPVSTRSAEGSGGGAWALQGSHTPAKPAATGGRGGGSRLLKLVAAGMILAGIVAAGAYFLLPAGAPVPLPDEAAPAAVGMVRIGDLPTEGYPPLGPVALRKALVGRIGGFQRCAVAHPQPGKGAGRVVVHAVVAPSGSVTSASADTDGPLGACLADYMREIRLPAFQSEPVEVSVPIEIPAN